MKTSSTALTYQSGFGNEFATEAVAGALPQGRNSPQRSPFDLYPELISGTAFTAPRHEMRRSWLYRRRPSVISGRYQPYAQPHWRTGADPNIALAPEPLRWNPMPIDVTTGAAGCDFVDGMRTLAANGNAAVQTGVAAHMYLANLSMRQRAFVNADGEMLIVPQQGRLVIVTEMGALAIKPGEVALIPRGVAFKVELQDEDGAEGPSRGYVCENYGAHFRLPELGPIGSNGLANARDFLTPVAAFEGQPAPTPTPAPAPALALALALAFAPISAPASQVHPDHSETYEVIKKFGGRLWRAPMSHSPFNVVAWHGNLAPCKYDTANFMTIGSISFDHPDPSIFTVLTSPSDTPGTANCDFVIFPPRWLVTENTFRPPWYHRNLMSEFMGLVYGEYDAKPGGFKPGGASLHNCMVPHGPDEEAFERASNAALVPHKLDNTLAFMFESRYSFVPTEFALKSPSLDSRYADCWAGLKDHFKP